MPQGAGVSSRLDLSARAAGTASGEALLQEIALKQEQVAAFLEAQGLDAVLVRRNENVAWATAGLVDTRVPLLTETQVAPILLTRSGERYYFAPNNEAPRLAAEEFAGLDWQPVTFPWHENRTLAEVKRIVPGKTASDSPLGDLPLVNLSSLRWSLRPSEIARYRWLGEHTAQAVTDVLEQLEPGVTEHEMEALTADALLPQGVLPSVLLMATDDRIRSFKHALARDGVLQKYGMVNLCARRWGLAVSITRFVHFGPLPDDLKRFFAAAAEVNAALLHATRVGTTAPDLFAAASEAYTKAGFPGEIEHHHQGGAAGYMEREWVATPQGSETVQDRQAFAWNPSIRGGKVEDTVVLTGGTIEVLTPTPSLPVVESVVGTVAYRSAGVLIRD